MAEKPSSILLKKILNIVPNFYATSYANGELTLIHVFNTTATEKCENEAHNHEDFTQ